MRLSINIDHIATLRQARRGDEPDPVSAAVLCELAGADGIVCHLREDRRHINDRDVRLLRQTIKTKLDLEMAATEEIISIALDVVPELVTLVPEKRRELTTEGGLNVAEQKQHLSKAIERFHAKNISVSLFVDPVKAQLDAAAEIHSDMIELHTGEYTNAKNENEQKKLLHTIRSIAEYGKKIGMGVNAGHGLNYQNVEAVAAIGAIDEMSIGHAVISRAALVGLDRAVREMAELVKHPLGR
ncbi:MAG: pyridoxine 5'-phosphate synthase [Bacteroidota bacterium]|nr:pyridoxine 5'-phosphate synthase [Bacteroidota bacterium]